MRDRTVEQDVEMANNYEAQEEYILAAIRRMTREELVGMAIWLTAAGEGRDLAEQAVSRSIEMKGRFTLA